MPRAHRLNLLTLAALLGAGAASTAAAPRPTCGAAAEEARAPLAAGGAGSCAVTDADERVVCWGASSTTSAVPPAAHAGQASLSMSIVDFQLEHREACSLSAAGGVTCWGGPNRTAFISSLSNSVVSSVASSRGMRMHSSLYEGRDISSWSRAICAIADGGARCDTPAKCNKRLHACCIAQVPSEAQSHQVAVVLGTTLACALSVDGDVTCWALFAAPTEAAPTETDNSAYDRRRRDMNPDYYGGYVPPPGDCKSIAHATHTAVPPGAQTGQLALTAGEDFVCSLGRADGSVHCWGPSAPHVPVWARTGAAALAAGPSYTCIITANAGAVKCWAQDGGAFVYEKDVRDYVSPVYVPLSVARGQVAIAAGLHHACTLDEQGRVTCWGSSARVPEMLTAPGAVRLPCVPRAAAALPPPTTREARCTASLLRAFPAHDAIGTQLGSLRVANETQCRAACCAQQPACAGYSLVARELPGGGGGGGGGGAASSVPCVLLSAVRQLVPSNLMSSGVRPDALPADAAAAAAAADTRG